MIRTRIAFGLLMAMGAAGVLIADTRFGPVFPCLIACLLVTAIWGGYELVRLFPEALRPNDRVVIYGLLAILASNFVHSLLPLVADVKIHSWLPVLIAFTAAFLVAFLIEMDRFREPGNIVPRLALTTFAFVYLGVLGSFFAQLRWLGDPDRTSLLLALVIFVPKAGDIGAFFTGTFLGKHKMTPLLSPKKTWEGFAGGMLAAMGTSIGLSFVGDAFRHGILEAAAFGLVIGVVGVLGDLAESLIKRDAQIKDAGAVIPGFGGLLDVIDSVLFAAPVAYFWFQASGGR